MGAKVTISSVAKATGRSISTVSAALNGASGVAESTRAEILQAAQRLGYSADPNAQQLRRRHSGMMGVVLTAGQAFQVRLLDAVYAAATDLNVDVLVAATTANHDQDAGVGALLARHCEGLVLIDPDDDDSERQGRIGKRVATVVLSADAAASGVDSVFSRDDVGISASVDHLVLQGVSRITYIDGADSNACVRRTRAYRQAMKDHGLERYIQVVSGGTSEADGARAAQQLLDGGDLPQALMCFNDHCAIGALMELVRAGKRVPQDILVMGYDGIDLAGVSALDLSTVDQDALLMSRAALKLAHVRSLQRRGESVSVSEALEEFGDNIHVTMKADKSVCVEVKPRMIVRSSTKFI